MLLQCRIKRFGTLVLHRKEKGFGFPWWSAQTFLANKIQKYTLSLQPPFLKRSDFSLIVFFRVCVNAFVFSITYKDQDAITVAHDDNGMRVCICEHHTTEGCTNNNYKGLGDKHLALRCSGVHTTYISCASVPCFHKHDCPL